LSGKLWVVATPIGNLGDLSPRAAEVLGAADFWLVEDSRVSGKLQAHLGLKKPMKVLNDHTNQAKVESYVKEIEKGASAALLSDGGTPVISDPGTEVVDLCHEYGIEVDGIPGPCAVSTALSMSGFYAQRYSFLGFLSRKKSAIAKEFSQFVESPYTIVFFESPFRVLETLEVARSVLGNRRGALCRELTKVYQEVVRFNLEDLSLVEQATLKGEITVVLEGRRKLANSDT
jgi:16S rRNA (cytidine1402-2'-O)-methyltransferase